MKTIQELREHRAAKAKELKDLFANERGDIQYNTGEEWTEANQKSYDTLVAEIKEIDAQIERVLSTIDLIGEQEETAISQRAEEEGLSEDEMTHITNEEKEAYTEYMRYGETGMAAKARDVFDSRFNPNNPQNAARFEIATDAGGGYTIPDILFNRLIEMLKAFGGVRSVATVQTVENGRERQWPTTDATSEVGEIVAEGVAASASDVTVGQITVKHDYYSSKIIELTQEFVQDTSVDIMSHVMNRLATRIGRIQNTYFTLGSANAAHNVIGIEDEAKDGYVAANGTGQVVAVDIYSMNHLIHSVDPAYREQGGCRFMFNDMTLGVFERMKDGDGRPLWLPSLVAGDSMMIYGYPYTINQDMPNMAASAKSIYFGQFQKYNIWDSRQIQFIRLEGDDRKAKRLIGFLAFMRSAARSLDTGGSLRRFKNAAT